MIKIYALLDSSNRLMGFSKNPSPNPNEVEIEVDENHEVLKNPMVYSYINGELIKDTAFQLENVRKNKFDELSKACQKDIYGYFEGTVNSVPYLFSFDSEAQANFTGTLALFTEGLVTEMEWTAYRDGKAERITLDRQNFHSVIATAFKNKDKKISRLRNELQPLLDSCKTIEEIQAVTW